MHDLWRRVEQSEAEGRRRPDARRAAKVDDGPAVLPRQPHHVGGLEVAVYVTRGVEPL